MSLSGCLGRSPRVPRRLPSSDGCDVPPAQRCGDRHAGDLADCASRQAVPGGAGGETVESWALSLRLDRAPYMFMRHGPRSIAGG